MKRTIILLVTLSLLGGCAKLALDEVLPDKRTKYRKSRALPDLEVPPDLTLERDDGLMTIPGEEAASQSMSDFYVRQAQRAAQGNALNDEWVRLEASQAELWPRMKDYWIERGFTLDLDDPELGILETRWQEQEPEDGAEETSRQRHTFTIYAEAIPGENSVQVLVSSRSEHWNGSDWQALRDSPYTATLRREFRQYLGSQARQLPEAGGQTPEAGAETPEAGGQTPEPES